MGTTGVDMIFGGERDDLSRSVFFCKAGLQFSVDAKFIRVL